MLEECSYSCLILDRPECVEEWCVLGNYSSKAGFERTPTKNHISNIRGKLFEYAGFFGKWVPNVSTGVTFFPFLREYVLGNS